MTKFMSVPIATTTCSELGNRQLKKSFLFKQYVWLVDTIRRARRISLADLSECWQRSDLSEGKPLSRTTFNRHRDAVEEAMQHVVKGIL